MALGPWGMGWQGVYVPGGSLGSFYCFGWFASAAVWHGLLCRVGACGRLLEISGMKVWGCVGFVGLSSVVLGPSCLGGGVLWCTFLLPVTTLIN